MRRFSLIAGLALAAPACLPAWTDAFDQWQAAGYAQLLQIDRPGHSLAPAGALDSNGDPATGLFEDGLWGRKVELKVSGPLGWQGFSAVLASQTDLNSASLADAYVQWQDDAWGQWRLGQVRLPLGWEQQLSGARLLGIQRALIWGFGDDGHLGNWGLGLAAERGWGLRWDRALTWAGGGLDQSVGAFSANGGDFKGELLGAARSALRQGVGAAAFHAGLSGLAGRASVLTTPASYAPLGLNDLSQAWQAGDTVGGKGLVALGVVDAGVDWGPLHGEGELAWEDLVGKLQGGGHVSAWLDLPAWEARKPTLYGRLEQAETQWADGVHRAGSLYRAATVGVSAPLPGGFSLKLEGQQLWDDDLPAFAGGRIIQAQLQWDL